jgi:hypothetical protein
MNKGGRLFGWIEIACFVLLICALESWAVGSGVTGINFVKQLAQEIAFLLPVWLWTKKWIFVEGLLLASFGRFFLIVPLILTYSDLELRIYQSALFRVCLGLFVAHSQLSALRVLLARKLDLPDVRRDQAQPKRSTAAILLLGASYGLSYLVNFWIGGVERWPVFLFWAVQ